MRIKGLRITLEIPSQDKGTMKEIANSVEENTKIWQLAVEQGFEVVGKFVDSYDVDRNMYIVNIYMEKEQKEK